MTIAVTDPIMALIPVITPGSSPARSRRILIDEDAGEALFELQLQSALENN